MASADPYAPSRGLALFCILSGIAGFVLVLVPAVADNVTVPAARFVTHAVAGAWSTLTGVLSG